MKVILSRKGFDSAYGGIASPILPDGTLLSLPIPSKVENVAFTDLHYCGQSYYDIIRGLKPKTKIKETSTCHLDPDIRRDVISRPDGWCPAFGQEGAALSHLKNQGVGVGDLFLFYGWFRMTEYKDGRLCFVKGAPDLHIIYGWLQVGQMIDKPYDVPEWLQSHPHNSPGRWGGKLNAIYLASDKLSVETKLSGSGCLHYSDRLVLTKRGCGRRVWSLPDFMRNIPVTYNSDAWRGDVFVSASRGQEFVFEADDDVKGWVKDMLQL